MRIEPVRGSLMVWHVRRALLDASLLIRRGPTRFVLRLGVKRPEALIVVPNRKPCPCDKTAPSPVSPTTDPPPPPPPIEHPPLELDWPSDRKHTEPEPRTIIVRNERPHRADGVIGSVFDLFI